MYSTESRRHTRQQSKEEQLTAGKPPGLGPYEQIYAGKRNASVFESYDNADISPRLENLSNNQKHNTSVGNAREGPRIFNVAEYFKSKGAKGHDFTEVNSDFRRSNKKSSFSNVRDKKEAEKRLY